MQDVPLGVHLPTNPFSQGAGGFLVSFSCKDDLEDTLQREEFYTSSKSVKTSMGSAHSFGLINTSP